MNDFVPEFDMDEDYSIPSSSGPPRQKSMQDEEILELLWRNGQVVVQSQNPRLQLKSSTQPLRFPPEDELTSWLQFPVVDPPFERELTFGFPPPCPPSPLLHHSLTQAPIQLEAPAEVNFPFSRTAPRFTESEKAISSGNNEMRKSMVDSSDTPANRLKPKFQTVTRRAAETLDREIPSMSVSREVSTGDVPRGSGTTDLMTSPPADDRKRKGRETVDDTTAEFQSEDAEIESYEPKKQSRGVTNRRSRAAEVHNLSERRRRDRINERMKTLQQLIPRCSKTDKASTLDETIEYLKTLQMQVQMMSSMGCGMVPLMLPGVQQYIPSLGMGIGMGINMEMGMNRAMMQFPNVLSGSAIPTMVGGAPLQLNPRFPLQPLQTLTVPVTDQSRNQQVSNNHEELNMARISTLPNPYQQSNNIHQVPMQIAQNQPSVQPRWQAEQTRGEVHENHVTG